VVEEFDLKGCPIYFDLVGKPKDEMRGSRGGGNASAEHRAQNPKWKIAEREEVADD
jgi:GTP-binding protein